MKQTKHFFLTAAMLLCSLAVSAHDFEVNGIYYNITSEEDLTVAVTYRGNYSDSYSDEYVGEVTIPSSIAYNGMTYSVTSIGYSAFHYCSSLTSIVIPEGVTSIGERAFRYCSSLTAITIPESVTSIASSAFRYCTSLIAITVDKGNTVYDSRGGCNAIIETNSNTLIAGCSATIIPEGVTSIGSSAFDGCSSLTAITIPESVTSIGNYAFSSCSSLTAITIPEGVTSIGERAFSGCWSLTAITIPEGIEWIGNGAFQETAWGANLAEGLHYIGKVLYRYVGTMPENTTIEVKEGTTSICSDAFRGCSNLTTITIPEGVTSIGNEAFYNCSSLTSITIPESVTSIGDYAFNGCSSLTSITIPENSQLMSIGRCAFSGCSSLTAITIPENVTSIGESVFSGCSSLTIINIPERVTSIGGSAFEGCSRLTSITIPENSQLTRIERYAFYGCSSLIDINIPEGVTSIGELAFSGCSSLEYVTLNCSNVSDWFSRNTAIKEVVLGDGVATVENKAFQGCSGLTSITIGKNVTEIGELSPNSSCAVFDNCTSLKEVLFEDGSEALAVGCNNYSANVRPNSRGEGLFYDCPLEKVYLGRNLSYDTRHRQAGASPFYAKGTLTSLTIGSEVTEVGENAFSDCGLDSITCYAMVPPACYASTFAGVDTSIPVYVPETSVADYQSAEVWKDFLGFVGVDTGITPSILNPQLSTIYDLHGRRITDTEGLKGIYIVNGKKTVIK